MRILIVGNVIKDVYLNLDARENTFEKDDKGVQWMNLPFDGSGHPFFSRTSVFGGAAVTDEVFKNLGIEAKIINPDAPRAYRYILSSGDGITYFIPSNRFDTKWVAPTDGVIDWIFVDRSAEITNDLVDKIKNYIGLTGKTRLASFVCAKREEVRDDSEPNSVAFSEAQKELIRLSNLVFSNCNLSSYYPKGAVCLISDNEVRAGSIVRRYKVSKNDLMTHLTSYSIIAATIFGAMLKGASTKDALDLATINVENSKVTETLTYDELKDKLEILHRKEDNLRLIAKSLVSPGRGILAADESGGSIHKKFEAAGIPDDEQHRRDYRNIFFTTRDLNKFVNGVILFDETARQKADDGRDFISYLTSLGIIPGIKVDQGLEPFSDSKYKDEKWTKGLETLPERLAEYYEMGARFAKWRAAFEVKISATDDGTKVIAPSSYAIRKNCEILAEYAKDCQNAGIVPIVEPEVVHDGNYSIQTCAKVTTVVLNTLFEELNHFGVNLEGCLLKVNMVLAGAKYEKQSTPDEVGKWTAEVLRRCCPRDLAGVVFLSGGQSVTEATDNLQAVTNNGPFPWPVTFSYARALQGPALDAWKGDNNNAGAAREAFRARLVANCRALIKNNLS